jgi:hypothetical protein
VESRTDGYRQTPTHPVVVGSADDPAVAGDDQEMI